MNKTEFHGESIGVAPSRFSLITVAQAPTVAVPSSVAADHAVTKSVGTKKLDEEKAKDAPRQHHNQEMNKAATATEKIQQDKIGSESAPPAKSAPLTK